MPGKESDPGLPGGVSHAGLALGTAYISVSHAGQTKAFGLKSKYRERNLIERFFCKAKEFRRLATRYEKLLERFASFILIVAGMLWA